MSRGPNSRRMQTPRNDLTARELSVAAHVATGMTNHQIATALGLTESTVNMHIVAAREKLDLPSKRHLAEYARAHGFTT